MKLRNIGSCSNHQNDNADESNKPEKIFRWNPFLAFVCLTATMGSAVSIGYSITVMNTLVLLIKSWTHETILNRYNTDLTDYQIDAIWASYVSILAAGAIPGSMVGAWFANKFGRKKTVLMAEFFFLFAGILLFFSRDVDSVEMFLVGRLFSGVATGLLFTTFPMYLMEITPFELTPTVSVFLSLGLAVGSILGQSMSLPQLLGTEAHWNLALSITTILVVGSLLLGYWYPESPIWLFQIKRNEDLAYQELKRLRGPNSEKRVQQELAKMRETSKAVGEKSKTSFMSVLRDRTVLLPMILVLTFGLGSQLCGLGALLSYSVEIFIKAGFTLEQAGWMNLGCGCLNLFVCLWGPYTMTNYNRRTLMILSSSFCGFSILGLTFSLNYTNEVAWFSVAAVIFLFMFIIFFVIGIGPIAAFIATELFEAEPRSVAMSIGSLSTWCGSLLIGMTFPLLMNVVGFFAFIPCAVACFYICMFSWIYLPETRNRDPSEVKPSMSNGLRSRVRSSNLLEHTVTA